MSIIITSKREGFRRCGIAHGKKAVTHPDDRFSADELALLTADPMLSVRIVPDPELQNLQIQETNPEPAPARDWVEPDAEPAPAPAPKPGKKR